MNTALLIIGVIVWIVGEFVLCSQCTNKFYFIITFIFCIALACVLKSMTNFSKEAGALEVYRNNTELKITYEIVNNDTINCDSVVIFKKIDNYG